MNLRVEYNRVEMLKLEQCATPSVSSRVSIWP
jgi:hypothetical protein